jgi:CRISPR/Cas system-associated exonuclease Cas4 (RecB family)
MSVWLSFTGYKQFKTCGEAYNLERFLKQKPPEKESKHNALVGTVLQRVYEDFYNQELWRLGKATSDELLKRADQYHWEFLEKNYVDFEHVTCKYASPYETLNDVLEVTPKILEGIKREKFLGPYAKSEVEIKVRFGASDFLIGHLDFVIRLPSGEVLILDGKASKHREKYIDEDQLHFYALLFYMRYKKLPDRMGFFYYRFADDPEKAIDWVEVSPLKVKDLRQSIQDVIDDIRKRRFVANPSTNNCKYCPYQTVCKARLSQQKVNREKRKMTSDKPEIDVESESPAAFIGFGNLKT